MNRIPLYRPYRPVAVMAGLLFCGLAAAHDVTVNITGQAVNASCDVASASQNQTIDLGDTSPADFPQAGSVTPPKSFTVQLQNCSGESAVVTSFTGSQQDGVNPALLALSGGTPATGLAIQVLTSSGTALDIRNPDTETVTGTSPVLTYQLQYRSTKDVVTAGDAGGVLYLSFSYQ